MCRYASQATQKSTTSFLLVTLKYHYLLSSKYPCLLFYNCRHVEIFLDMSVIWTDFKNLVSPNNKICSRNIDFLSVHMKFCQSNPSVWHFLTSLQLAPFKPLTLTHGCPVPSEDLPLWWVIPNPRTDLGGSPGLSSAPVWAGGDNWGAGWGYYCSYPEHLIL